MRNTYKYDCFKIKRNKFCILNLSICNRVFLWIAILIEVLIFSGTVFAHRNCFGNATLSDYSNVVPALSSFEYSLSFLQILNTFILNTQIKTTKKMYKYCMYNLTTKFQQLLSCNYYFHESIQRHFNIERCTEMKYLQSIWIYYMYIHVNINWNFFLN